MGGEENILIILSSPSGVGKTTLTKKIQQKYKNFKISVSHTTRTPRSNEVDGVDYYFVSKEKFKELIDKGKFYEYAKIFENYYGTLKKNVDDTIKENDILFDIDWQGRKQLSKFKNLNLIKIYLITDKKELKSRLIKIRWIITNKAVVLSLWIFDQTVKGISHVKRNILNGSSQKGLCNRYWFRCKKNAIKICS